ncbi:hypothetical protein OOJ91_17775 [Micromonospora lupini]|uniref:hypothetical protein n=1 Tax=Micromonospora lupini TaxID=285679 RepID=UPI002257158C|nr:hypothetical protein [Micromonospora lupini]MCX5067693.1 hypothetical protein [Micromonospora lupini]
MGAAVTDGIGHQGPLLGIHGTLFGGAIGIGADCRATCAQERAAHDALNLVTTDGFGYSQHFGGEWRVSSAPTLPAESSLQFRWSGTEGSVASRSARERSESPPWLEAAPFAAGWSAIAFRSRSVCHLSPNGHLTGPARPVGHADRPYVGFAGRFDCGTIGVTDSCSAPDRSTLMFGRSPRRLRAALALAAVVAFVGAFSGQAIDLQMMDYTWGAPVFDKGVTVAR